MYCADFGIGDLVCIRSWSDEGDDCGWISIPSDFGIIIEVIEIEHDYVFINHKIRCYDYKIYWIAKEQIDTIPDLAVEKYSDWLRRKDEK